MWSLWWTRGNGISFLLVLGFSPVSTISPIPFICHSCYINLPTANVVKQRYPKQRAHTHTHLRSLCVLFLYGTKPEHISGRHLYESKLILSVPLQSLHQIKDLPRFTSTTPQLLEVLVWSHYILLSRVTGV
jgi:hypothetical protein